MTTRKGEIWLDFSAHQTYKNTPGSRASVKVKLNTEGTSFILLTCAEAAPCTSQKSICQMEQRLEEALPPLNLCRGAGELQFLIFVLIQEVKPQTELQKSTVGVSQAFPANCPAGQTQPVCYVPVFHFVFKNSLIKKNPATQSTLPF